MPYKRSALFLHQQWILSLKADTYYTASLQPHLQQLGETDLTANYYARYANFHLKKKIAKSYVQNFYLRYKIGQAALSPYPEKKESISQGACKYRGSV